MHSSSHGSAQGSHAAAPQLHAAHPPPGLPAELPAEAPGAPLPDEVFDRYAHLVRATLGVPVGLVSMVSATGQVFPGAEGLPAPWQQTRSTGLSHSFCQHVVARDAPLVVDDAREDPALADNLAIADIGVVAYAGFPVHAADGTAVGALCAIDTSPRTWSEHELDVLAHLATSVSSELALRAAAARAEEAVRAERAAAARTTHVTESMAVGYLAMDADWVVTYVNSRAVHALGRPRAQLVGGIIWELFPATVGTDFDAAYRRAAAGEVVAFDAYYPEPLNAWYEVRAVAEAGGVALYFLDITDRHVAQRAAQAAAARISGLAEVALAMVDLEDVTDLVTVIAERGLAALGADGGAVAVHDPSDPGVLLSYVTAGYGPGARADYAHLPLHTALPVCEAALTGRRVLVPDREACTAYSPVMAGVVDSTGSQAFASMPMRADGRVIGVVTAGWDAPQTFGAEQVELLEAFAAQCAQALQRLQSRDAERRSAERARSSAARQAALVTIAQALADADTQDDVLDVLAGQGTDLLGSSGCGICLRSDDGEHVDTLVTDSRAAVRHTVRRTPADVPLPAVRAAASGEAVYLPDREQTERAFPGSGAVFADAGVHASAAVPMRARGRLLGCLSVGFDAPRDFSSDERDLLTAFAALTAQALDRIAAHDAEHAALEAVSGIAETLQRSMLTAPPELPHLQIAVRYAATAKSAEVGGDWHDAFLTARGVATLAIGDVTGHDMAAAAVMGQLRNLLRGLAFTLDEPPAAVLAALDRAATGLGIETVATAVLAQVEQDADHRAAGTRLLRWSSAGHLPPLLIEADGTTRFLDEPSDLVLGWDPGLERHDHEHVLEPGSTVLLYTDGLVERRRVGLDRGLAWLAQATAQMSGATPEELCDALVELVGDHLDDDVALLALRAHPETGPARAPGGT